MDLDISKKYDISSIMADVDDLFLSSDGHEMANDMQSLLDKAKGGICKNEIVTRLINEIIRYEYPEYLAAFVSTAALNNPDIASFIRDTMYKAATNHWGNSQDKDGQEHYQNIITALDDAWKEDSNLSNLDENLSP